MSKNYYDSKEYLVKLDKYWRACNYLSAAQLYLLDNPLLKEKLKKKHIKKKILNVLFQHIKKRYKIIYIVLIRIKQFLIIFY